MTEVLATLAGLVVGTTITLVAYRFTRRHIMRSIAVEPWPWPEDVPEERDRCPECGCPVGGLRVHQDDEGEVPW